MTLTPDALRRLETDAVVWLTTVGASGAPVPNPVWFVVDGDDIVVFTSPGTVKLRNIAERPVVSLNFNSDPHGDDIVVITGTAAVTPGVAPSTLPQYVDKYSAAISEQLNTTLAEVDATYDTEIRIRPTRVRGLSG